MRNARNGFLCSPIYSTMSNDSVTGHSKTVVLVFLFIVGLLATEAFFFVLSYLITCV